MRAWVAMLTVAAALAGCTSGETTDDAGDDLVVDERPVLQLTLQVTGNTSGEAPFTTSFALASGLDLPNATYAVLVARAPASGTGAPAVGDNATAPDGEAEGNATADEGEAEGNTTESAVNGTEEADGEPMEVLTGDGLPADFELTFEEPGTYTVLARVAAEGYPPAEAVADVLVHAVEAAEDAAEAVENATSVPDPVVITGSALAPNPLNFQVCLHDGIDGDMHDIAPAAEGWSYTLEPAADFSLYWFGDGGYLETGDDAGEVPPDATRVEVCSDTGVAGAEYTVTLTHPQYMG